MALNSVIVLRRYVDEIDADSAYSDAELALRIESSANLYAAARDIWIEKMAGAASLVNISEGGSSRSLGSLQAQYEKMVTLYSGLADSASAGGSPNSPILRAITRV